jgi:hypothetical protein
MNKIVKLENATCRSEQYTKGLIKFISYISASTEYMVEIGSYQGESTKIFLENLPKIKKLYAVDPWENGYCAGDVCSDGYSMEIVERNFDLRVMSYEQLSKQKTKSENFASKITDETLDFVYIDGNHTYESCKNDIELWLPKIKKTGFIGGHDYLENCFPGVVNAVNEKFGKPDITFIDTSWLKKV